MITVTEIKRFAQGRSKEEIRFIVRELVDLENERGKSYGFECVKFDLGDFPYFYWLLFMSRAALEIL